MMDLFFVLAVSLTTYIIGIVFFVNKALPKEKK
jgi:hypothetical protein